MNAAPRLGGRADRFEVRRQLGEGGMGIVYEALDKKRSEIVALKTVSYLSADALLMFKEEFRAFQHLSHPNLVTLGELFGEGDDWYFTMELVEGNEFIRHVRRMPRVSAVVAAMETVPNLDSPSMVRRALVGTDTPQPEPSRPIVYHGSLEELSLRRSIAQLVHGLQHIHKSGKVHRDIKSSNVMVTDEGRVVILDFGLAIDSSRARQLESMPPAAGTPLTMAPEQAMGTPVGPAADWYAVGVLLFQALTGRDPFEGSIAKLLAAKISSDSPDPRSLVSTAPADLSELASQLLSLHPEHRPNGNQILNVLGGASIVPPEPKHTMPSTATQSMPFVGREKELTELERVFADVRDRNEGRVAYVHGESGIGKSTLVTRFRLNIERRDPDVLVFAGKCYEHEAVPYKAFDGLIDTVSKYLRKLPIEDVRALLPRHASLLAKTFPVLRRVEAVAELSRPNNDLEPLELRNRVFSALRELFGVLAMRRPVLVIIDDLQWADKDSLAMLTELLRDPGAPRFMLLATIRTDVEARTTARPPTQVRDPGATLTDTSMRVGPPVPLPNASLGAIKLSSIAPAEGTEATERFSLGRFRGTRFAMDPTSTWPSGVHVHLGRLSETESSDLAMQLVLELGKATVDIEAVVRESRGHPLFLDELMRADRPNASSDLNEVLWARIRQLDPDARRLLEVVCVAPGPMMQAIATRAASLDADVKRIKLLKAAHLVRTTGGTRATDFIEPYHNRVRMSVRHHLTRDERRGYHKRTALVLETSGAQDPEAMFLHFRGADEPDRARPYAILAAERATALLAFDRAASFYEHALLLSDPGSRDLYALRIGLADSLANAGRGAEAAEAYKMAARGRNAAEIIELRRKAAEQLLRNGYVDEGIAEFRAVLELLGMDWPKTSGRALASFLWKRVRLRLRGIAFRTRDVSELSPETLAKLDVCWAGGAGLGVVDQVRGFELLLRYFLMALDAGEPSRVARGMSAEAVSLAATGQWAKSKQMLQDADAITASLDDPYPRNLLATSRCSCLLLEGRWSEALDVSLKAQDHLREECTNVFWEIATARQATVWALCFLGNFRELDHHVSRGVRETQEIGDLYALMSLRSGFPNLLWLVRDNPERARFEMEDSIRRWSRSGFHVQHLFDLLATCNVSLYQGDDAVDLVREIEKPIADSILLRVHLNRVLYEDVRARTLLARAVRTGDLRCANIALKHAKRMRSSEHAWSNAMYHLVAAQVAYLNKRTEEALAELKRAHALFTSADMFLHSAVAARSLAKLLGGDESARLAQQATAYFEVNKIKQPTLFARIFAPGFTPLHS